jgi:TMEM175 potassium channel family protein
LSDHDSSGQSASDAERGLDLDRVVFFSDAVFAIAMTVLVLTLQLPARTTDADVGRAIREMLPSIYSYALSFVVVGVYWLIHHRMFRYIRRTDTVLLVLNLAILGFVAFVPFPTSVLGEHGDTTAAVVLYASTIGMLGSLVAALWAYASHGYRLIAADTPAVVIRHTFWRSLIALVFFASIPIAFVSPQGAEYFWLTIVVWRVLLRRHYGSIEPRSTRAAPAG